MRSLKSQARRGRAAAKPSRRKARTVSRSLPRFGTRRRSPGPFAHALNKLRDTFSPHHPAMWISACLLTVVVVGILIAGGYVARAGDASRRTINGVLADAGFGISSIRISGNSHTDPHDILGALGFRPGDSIFAVDVQTARQHLLALEWVADAQVRRQYPDSVSVNLVEKLPFALWETPAGSYLVERSGRVIGLFDPHAFPHLPVLLGTGAPEAAAELVEAVAAHRAIAARTTAFARVSDRRWNLLLNDDVVVQLPEEGWARQLDVLERLIVDKAILERDISEIDLRAPDNFFFVLRNGQKQQMRGNAA